MESLEEYIGRIQSREEREKEKDILCRNAQDIDQEIKTIIEEKSIELLKDVDKLPSMIKGVSMLNNRIDEIEECIATNILKEQEKKKEITNINQTKTRVIESLEGIKKITGIIKTIEEIERVSTRTMVQIEKKLNKKESLSETEVQGVYIWIGRYKKLQTLAKYFSGYPFYMSIATKIESTKKTLMTVGNLLVQWWIFEITTGIPEISKDKTSKDKEGIDEYMYKEIEHSKTFAKKNKELFLIGQYIYSQIEQEEEFVKHINAARKKEISKAYDLKESKQGIEEELKYILQVFLEYLKVDREITRSIIQEIDPVVEEYDRLVKTKIEKEMDKHPDTNPKILLKMLKDFLTELHEHHCMHLEGVLEILVVIAYKCIDSKGEAARKQALAIIQKKVTQQTLQEVEEVIISFFKDARRLVLGVDQVQNELDDMILKCINQTIKEIKDKILSSKENPLVIKTFVTSLRTRLLKELEEYLFVTNPEDSLAHSLPELNSILKTEQEIVTKKEKELNKALNDVNRQIQIKLNKITDTTDISFYSNKISTLLTEYRAHISPEYLQKQIEERFLMVLKYLPCLKRYRQIDSLENEFALLYKSAEYLNQENEVIKKVLKIFTEVDHIRKTNKKELDDPIDTDLDSLIKKYNL
ncbi:hypothetical protein NEOKW01_0202 [Nematocida sp. AWRm80]|nr:hypothetical protein NEOKW01_0202 [Nematocida sp. AWRm80]